MYSNLISIRFFFLTLSHVWYYSGCKVQSYSDIFWGFMLTVGLLRAFWSKSLSIQRKTFLTQERLSFRLSGRVYSASNARWSKILSLSRVFTYGRFIPGLHTTAGVKRPGVTRCMPRDRWTRIKAVVWDISSRGCFSGGQVHFQKPQNV